MVLSLFREKSLQRFDNFMSLLASDSQCKHLWLQISLPVIFHNICYEFTNISARILGNSLMGKGIHGVQTNMFTWKCEGIPREYFALLIHQPLSTIIISGTKKRIQSPAINYPSFPPLFQAKYFERLILSLTLLDITRNPSGFILDS